MAKKKTTVALKNAEIDIEKMTISEFNKDGDLITEYQLIDEILKDWDGVNGISLTISYDADM